MWSLRPRSLPAGFIPPCLPTGVPCAPPGEQWWHEIKHDGIRVVARKENKRVKLYSRPGNDLTHRFPLIVDGLARLRARSCILDGEAVACGEDGMALFEHIRYRRYDSTVFMYAFDLIELNGDDVRREPLELRRAALERLLARAGHDVRFNEHLEAEGPLVFEHACRMGLEGIVSKRKGSWYQSGRSRDWVKAKNPNAPAVRRLAEEDWGRSWSSSGSRRPSPSDAGAHPLPRLPQPSRLLCLWALPPQRHAQRGLAPRRHACAFSLLPHGVHTLRDDRCGRAPGLGTACEQEACVRRRQPRRA
jgi:bifunctional non-homologous end joining protein LigD